MSCLGLEVEAGRDIAAREDGDGLQLGHARGEGCNDSLPRDHRGHASLGGRVSHGRRGQAQLGLVHGLHDVPHVDALIPIPDLQMPALTLSECG